MPSSEPQPIDIPKIVEQDMKTLDEMKSDVTDVMVPRAQYRAMLMYIQQRDQIWDGLVLKMNGAVEQRDEMRSDLEKLADKHGIGKPRT